MSSRRKELANASTNLESDEIVNCCRQQHYEGPLLQGFETFNQFKQYKTEELLVTVATGDNCICVGGSICIVKNIISSSSGSIFLVVSKFSKKEEFLSYPFDLSHVGIFSVSELSDDVFVYSISVIEFKYVLLPHLSQSNCFVAIPFIHKKISLLEVEYVLNRSFSSS